MQRIFFCTSLLLSSVFVFAQSDPIELDKIVAEVEDQIILESDIKNMASDIKRQGGTLPSNPDCAILEQLIIEKLMAAQAKRDSLTVTDQEVERDIELRIRNFIQMYGSLENLEKVSGRTVFQIKQDFKEDIREKKLAENMQSKIMEGVKVTPTVVRRYFDKIPKDSLPFYESEIMLGALTMYPKKSSDLDDYLKSELLEYKKQLEQGRVSFDFLVNTYSQDPSKVQNQGIYQLNVNDKFWDPNFLAASFRLETDEISPPVKSRFGYHLIKMIERRGTSATVQHLLRMSQPSEVEVEETKNKLKEIRQKILDSQLSFEQAIEKYGEDELAKFNGGYYSNYDGSLLLSYDQVDPEILKIVKDFKAGDISEPTEFQSPQGAIGFRLVYMKLQTKPHRESMEFDYKKISDRVLQEKKIEALNLWIQKNIRETNWRTIDKFSSCPSISQWVHK